MDLASTKKWLELQSRSSHLFSFHVLLLTPFSFLVTVTYTPSIMLNQLQLKNMCLNFTECSSIPFEVSIPAGQKSSSMPSWILRKNRNSPVASYLVASSVKTKHRRERSGQGIAKDGSFQKASEITQTIAALEFGIHATVLYEMDLKVSGAKPGDKYGMPG